MSRCLAVLLVLSLSSGALAGGNPDVRIFIDFDSLNYVHEIQPELYTNSRAYVCLDNVGDGVTTVSFRLSDPWVECAGVAIMSWTPVFAS